MAKIWVKRLIAGTQKFSECPEKYKSDVLLILNDYLNEGLITSEEYETIINS